MNGESALDTVNGLGKVDDLLLLVLADLAILGDSG